MVYDVHLERSAAQPLAIVRRRASQAELPTVVPAACGVVWAVIRANRITGAGRNVALYLDGQINLEVGVEMGAPFAGVGEVVASALPAGVVATTVHLGPYPQLGAAHQAILQWCASHAYALAGPSWELYGHWQEQWNRDPSAIRTDIFYLLKDNGALPVGPRAAPTPPA